MTTQQSNPKATSTFYHAPQSGMLTHLRLEMLIKQIGQYEIALRDLDDTGLRTKTNTFKMRLAQGATLDELLSEAFAVVREAASRTLGQRHYAVQIMAGVALHYGTITAMMSGEGKTLAVTLPLYLNALEGKGCHLVTVNDHLAKVGAGWMGPIYHLLGLSVGVIAHGYSALFDPAYIDPEANPMDQCLIHWRPCLRREAYAANITYGTNTEFGFDYLRDNMVVELDQLVQRPLHYAIVDEVDNILIDEARTPLTITGPAETSSAEYRRFARLVPILKPSSDFIIDPDSKIIQLTNSGTIKMERALGIPEDERLYDRKYEALLSYLNNALKAQFLYQRERDYVVENGEVVIVDEFTGSRRAGQRWNDGLHQAVEAKENVMIKPLQTTLAIITNASLFKQYHKLCGLGLIDMQTREALQTLYGLATIIIPTRSVTIRIDHADSIYRTERAKFNAILQEIQAMQALGRPVIISSASAREAEQLGSLLADHSIHYTVLNTRKPDLILAQAGRLGAVTFVTSLAGTPDIVLGGDPNGMIMEILERHQIRIGAATPDQLQAALTEAREVAAAECARVIELGGLHVIGMARGAAHRIDTRLRGMAGRRGAPGSTHFYLSLEDKSLRSFGPIDRLSKLMSQLGVHDDMPLTTPTLSSVINTAQEQIEQTNFALLRKNVLLDHKLNQMQQTMYEFRSRPLNQQDCREYILNLISEEINTLLDTHLPARFTRWDVAALERAIRTIDPLLPANQDSANQLGMALAAARVQQSASALSSADPVRAALAEALHQQIVADYAARETAIAPDNMRYVECRMLLGAIDRQWIDYLPQTAALRQSTDAKSNLDQEAIEEFGSTIENLFNETLAKIEREIVYQIIPVTFQYEAYMRQVVAEQQQRLQVAQHAGETEKQANAAKMVPKNGGKIGRNDLCPCGSGKKFKYCHEGRESELFALLQSRSHR